jgi:hypothetical protein
MAQRDETVVAGKKTGFPIFRTAGFGEDARTGA